MEDFQSETYVARYRLDDGMLSCVIKADQIIDQRLAERITRERKEFCFDHVFPTLIIIPKKNLLMETEALHYLGSAAGVEGTSAMAVVMHSTVRRLLTNFNLLFYKQRVPFRLFTSKAEAKLWLFDFILDEESLEIDL